MSMKKLLGLENTTLSDLEILEKIREAQLQNKSKVVFVDGDGSKI